MTMRPPSQWEDMSSVFLTSGEAKIIQAIRTRQQDLEQHEEPFDLLESLVRWADGELDIMFRQAPKPPKVREDQAVWKPATPLLSETERQAIIEAKIQTILTKHDITYGLAISLAKELRAAFNELFSRPELRKQT